MRTPSLVLTLLLAFVASAYGQSRFYDLRSNGANNTTGPLLPERHRTEPPKAPDDSPSTAAAHRLEREVFGLLNAERVHRGLSELPWSDDCAQVARIHSDNMAAQKFFSHRGTDGSMVDDRADRVGLGAWRVIGENIAYVRGFENPAATAIEKWLESTAHRNNLLGPNWQESAVGVAISDDGTYYMTQVFLLRK